MHSAKLFLASSVLFAFALSPLRAGDDAPKQKQLAKDKASLYQLLDADFEELLKSEANPEPLRKAAGFLAETNQNSRWMSFFSATALMRKHRSTASVPLLLKYMVEHATFGSSHVIIPEYINTLRVLTGEKVAEPDQNVGERQKSMIDAVAKLYTAWWEPNKKTLTADLDKMPAERLKVVVEELLRHAEKEFDRSHYNSGSERLVSTEALYRGLTSALRENAGRSGRQAWWREELHGRMTPILLDVAGYVQKPGGAATEGPTRVSFPAVPLLAVLRQEGQAPILNKIAADEQQNNATRLTCILALHFAGEDIDTKVALSIFGNDPRLECRVLSLLTLGLSQKDAAAVPALLEALDDNNREIRLAAIHSLSAFAPKQAVPKLAKVVRERSPAELVQPAMQLLGAIGGDDAAAALVEFMEKSLQGGGKNYDVYHALNAFSTATNTSWTEAGAHDTTYYAEKAQKAIAWWKARPK